jgi:hypothetical protein
MCKTPDFSGFPHEGLGSLRNIVIYERIDYIYDSCQIFILLVKVKQSLNLQITESKKNICLKLALFIWLIFILLSPFTVAIFLPVLFEICWISCSCRLKSCKGIFLQFGNNYVSDVSSFLLGTIFHNKYFDIFLSSSTLWLQAWTKSFWESDDRQ